MMGSPVQSLAVVICTYNRAELLRQTLTALRACTPPRNCEVEIVVVDNNSSDHTASVVSEIEAQPGFPIRSGVEQRQGKSYALNRALSMTRAVVIALTDDDVLPAPDWLVRIVTAFRGEPIVFVFGKVLPRWAVPPPPELLPRRARDIWGPLALVDYGDEPVRYTTSEFRRLRLPIGANLAVRREAVERVGGWRTDLGRVDNSLVCGEDRELSVRLFRAGIYEGLYDPELTVRHYVPAMRMTRRYFRRWYFWHGRTIARMADSFYVDLDLPRVPRLARVPRFIYGELLQQLRRWLAACWNGGAVDVLIQELLIIQYFGFFFESWRPYRQTDAGPPANREHADLARPEAAAR
jgi:glycosyltransferase involved in cell wall biosynthesis